MDLGLQGKTAVVTGVGDERGLGFAIARRLLGEGCECAVIDLDAAQVERMAEALRAFGPAYALKADVSDEGEMSAAIAAIVAASGKIDIYVNNAGICPCAPIRDTSFADWNRGMEINLGSVFLSAKLVPPHMPRGGSIVNAASFVSLIPTAGLSMYSASKAGVLTLTRVMAAELGDRGIRVNAYVPGLMVTPMNRVRIDTISDKLRTQMVNDEFGMPDDVANAVAFLVSDKASYINGTHLEISGGKFCVQNPDYARK